ncbi:MAG TPA: TraR/DksA C4-type zinc finger protein [Balneolales bacterium]|nr:TraR/DksA C4-type zinc finger protein [Balneolales bacterium]
MGTTTDQTKRVSPYTDEELEYFRKIILGKRSSAMQELDILQGMLKETIENESDESVYSLHMADAGTDVMDRERTYMLYYRTRKFINYLDAALKRIDNKTYGVCKATGKKISKGRLEAVPHTQLSIEAKLKHR